MALTKVIGAGAEGLTLSSTDLKIDAGGLNANADFDNTGFCSYFGGYMI